MAKSKTFVIHKSVTIPWINCILKKKENSFTLNIKENGAVLALEARETKINVQCRGGGERRVHSLHNASLEQPHWASPDIKEAAQQLKGQKEQDKTKLRPAFTG